MTDLAPGWNIAAEETVNGGAVVKVTVTERKFTLPIMGIEYTLTEQEARELWASLNEHFRPAMNSDEYGRMMRGRLLEQYNQDVQPGATTDCNT